MATTYTLKRKTFGLIGGTAKTVGNVTGGVVSGAGSMLDNGATKAAAGLGGAGLAVANPVTGALAGGAAAAGAATGATLGAIAPIPGGTLIGGAIGGTIGGIGTLATAAKAGQIAGSTVAQAGGEALKGIGNSMRTNL